MATSPAPRVWTEQVRGGYPAPSLFGLSGRDRLTWWTRGGAPAPPLSRLTGVIYTRVGDGTAGAEMPASGWLLNSAGLVGGGTLAILADVALSCAIDSQLPPRRRIRRPSSPCRSSGPPSRAAWWSPKDR